MLRLLFLVTLAFLVGVTFAQYDQQYYTGDDFQTQYYEEPGVYDHYVENYNQVQKSPIQKIADKFRNFMDYHGSGLRRQGIATIIVPFIFPLLIGAAVAGGVIFVSQDAAQQRNALNDRLNSVSSENSVFTGAIQMLTNRLAQSEARINALQAELNAIEMENMAGEETTPGPDEETTTSAGSEEDTTTAGPDDDTTTAGPDDDTTTAGPDDDTTTTDASAETTTDMPTTSGEFEGKMGRSARMDKLFWYQ
ncbi:hypothetical protein TCAL_12987 [Tigriopus californicus]|uniref:Uncharacterized protein n=2 Tax=Tigriopus californicus TaxID=6832 RepID=A0A553PR39_TIGCA|nr:hypothetical protein TCAL_12987 [Tigriopus californicus]|eukprot:TCALIF_12987-PA protein Name:"Protein of unknown function" AED:0.24 eAED:0.24 QI:138/1/0.66/1/0.5/0.66/3/0/249